MDIEKFKSPDPRYTNAPFWSWNDRLHADECKRQLDEMIEQGWQQFFLHCRVGLVTGYLSDEWFDAVRASVETAKETGALMWLYDEDKWPSGYGSGDVAAISPDYRNRYLILLNKDELNTETDTVLWQSDRQAIAERVATLDNKWFNGSSYVDLMNPEAVLAFIKSTHEVYKTEVGEHFGKEIPGIFTDEPCFLYRGIGGIYLQWSRYLPDFFEQLKGYQITDHLESLFFKEGDWQRIRYDFFDASLRLFINSFTKPYYEWCEQNNLKLTGHMMAEDSLVYSAQWIGSAMPHYEYFHIPGIDKLCRHIEQHVTVKQVSSVSDQLGKEQTLSEVFGCIGQQSAFLDRKWIGDWQASLGINFVNSHLTLYSMRGERKRDYPANFSWSQPWWEQERGYADYTGRLCYALSEGKRDVDILFIHPSASIWSLYEPDCGNPDLHKAEDYYSRPFERLAYELTASKLDFHFGDEMIMEKYARVEDGKIIIGQHAYSTVIVPAVFTLSSNTWELLCKFEAAAGEKRLIFTDGYPQRIDGIKTEVVPIGTLMPDIEHTRKAAAELYPDRIAVCGKFSDENIGQIMVHVRNINDEKAIFINNSDHDNTYEAVIKIRTGRTPVAMDLMDGTAKSIPFTKIDDWVYIDCKFAPASSILILLSDQVTESQAELLGSGVSFGDNQKQAVKLDAEFKPDGSNSMVINYMSFSIGGKQITDDDLCAKAWFPHFYEAPDGTPFEAAYTFDAGYVPENEVFAAVECAENLDSITINGIEVYPVRKKGDPHIMNDTVWMDASLAKVDISGKIAAGKNVIKITGKKINNITCCACHSKVPDYQHHYPTEVEPIYIVGDFGVGIQESGRYKMVAPSNDPKLYPTFSGKLEYTAVLDNSLGKFSQITLEDAECACAELFIDGKSAGVKYLSPFDFIINDLPKAKVDVKAVLYPTLFNLTGPAWIEGIIGRQGFGPGTFTESQHYTDHPVLIEYGMSHFEVK